MKTFIYKLLCLILCFALVIPAVGCGNEDTDNDKTDNSGDNSQNTGDNNGDNSQNTGDNNGDNSQNTGDNNGDNSQNTGDNSSDKGEEDAFIPEDGKCYFVLNVKNFGEIVVELLPEYAPITVEHFISVVESDFYPGTTFHRILSNFMIQGGAPKSGSPSINPIVGEFMANGYNNTLSHERGVISMARTNAPNSATSQFFICNADYPSLDGQYAAFGRVVEGMDVVDAITEYGMLYTSYQLNGMIYDVTKQPVIESAEIIDKR